MKGKDLGVSTWPPDAWKIGGGTVWGWFSYDPDLNLIYYGTGNPGPWNSNQRPGDNLWTTTFFARDPDNGWRIGPISSIRTTSGTTTRSTRTFSSISISTARRERCCFIPAATASCTSSTGRPEICRPIAYDTVTAFKGVDLKTGRIIRTRR